MSLDKDGYPTEEILLEIQTWDYTKGYKKLMSLIKDLWRYSDQGWGEEKRGDEINYSISTFGWSGNEDLIAALRDNMMFWSLCWLSSRRGGHYEFTISKQLQAF